MKKTYTIVYYSGKHYNSRNEKRRETVTLYDWQVLEYAFKTAQTSMLSSLIFEEKPEA